MTAQYEALAEKVEGAEGASRQMDRSIVETVRPIQPGRSFWTSPALVDVPAYTASLDAAMSLVPTDVVGWRMDWSGRRAIVRMGFGGIPETVEAWAATPALALTAAALLAQAALSSEMTI